jgi:hypothetical protein
VVYGPEFGGRIDLNVTNMPWREALDRAARAAGKVTVERGGIVRLLPADRAGDPPDRGKGVLPAEPERNLTIDLKDRPLVTVCAWLTETVGIPICPGPDAFEEKVTILVEEMPWQAALRLIARRAGCVVRARAGAFELVRAGPVSFDIRNDGLGKVIGLVAAFAGANVVYGSEVEGSITARVHDVPWTEALDALLDVAGLVVVREGTLLWVTTPERAAAAPGPDPLLPGVEGTVSLGFRDGPLTNLVGPFGEGAGVRIEMEPEVAALRTTFFAEDLPWRVALDLVARRLGLAVHPAGPDGVRLSQPPWVSMQFVDADLRKVVPVIGAYAGVSVNCAPEAGGTVTMRLNRVGWKTALRAAVRAAGRTLVEVDEKTFRVE